MRSRTITHIAPRMSGIDAAAMAPRAHVAPCRARGGRQLEHDLPEEEHERARDIEAVGQEGAVAGVRLALRLGAAHREDHLLGLAREQVAAARAAVDEQPDPGRVAALDLGAVRRRRADHHEATLLLHPSERGDVLVGAEQDPGLAGARLRREVGLPLGELVALLGDPARHRRRAAVAQGVAQDGEGEPVDLQEDDAGDVCALPRALALGDPPGHLQRVLVVVVRAHDGLQHHADRGDHERGEERVAEGADVDVVRQDLIGDHEHGARLRTGRAGSPRPA